MRISGTTGIDMGNLPISNASQLELQEEQASPFSGFKNYLINGNFDMWQRGTSQTISGLGSADRWSMINVGTSTRTIYKTISTDTDRPFFNSHAILSTTLTTLDTSTVSRGIRNSQAIEDVTRLAGKTVTLSFWARATNPMPIETALQQIFGTGGTPSSAVSGIGAERHQLLTSWQKFKTTITVPSILGKTLGTEGVHTSCTNVKFHLLADSTTALIEGLTGTLQPSNGTIVFIAEVQLEEGNIATPFEQRPIGLELSLCQRYYERVDVYWRWDGSLGGTAAASVWLKFSTTKRVIPTVSVVESANLRMSQAGIFANYDGFKTELTFNSAGSIENRNLSTIYQATAEL